jgi:hypothetical protein
MTIIYLDMDSVIADFDKWAFETFGKRFDAFATSQEAWEAAAPYQNLYRDLEKMPDADELVDGVYNLAAKHNCVVGILTAIPKLQRFPQAEQHKREWLEQHWGQKYPGLLENFNTGPYSQDKQNHCRPGDVLIDDRDINIRQWNAKGGKGIFHVSAQQSLAQLKKYLELAP